VREIRRGALRRFRGQEDVKKLIFRLREIVTRK
jgi:hypothetical protein